MRRPGSFDLGANIPAAPLTLLAPTVELVARAGLHPALSDLLIETASEVHGRGGLLHRAGEFPAPLDHEYPISGDAARFYKSGKSLSYRYLPFWLASLVDRVAVVLIPALIVLVPALRLIPGVYAWRIRRRPTRKSPDGRRRPGGVIAWRRGARRLAYSPAPSPLESNTMITITPPRRSVGTSRVLPLLLALLAALVPAAASAGAPATDGWAAFRDQFLEDTFAAHPEFAAMQGRHEFDGRLPDWSAQGLAAEVARLEQARRRAEAFAASGPDSPQRFERDYLLARVDADLFWLRDAQQPLHNPAYYTGSLDPSVYLTRPYAPLDVRLRAFIGYARAIPRAAAQIRSNLRAPLPPTFVTLGIESFGGYAGFFHNEVPGIFAAVKDPDLQRQLREAIEPAATAMQGLADWFRGEQALATGSFALGAERFARMLRMTERVDTPLAQLATAGRADLARNRAALAAECARYLPGAPLQACVDKVESHKPQGGSVEGARAQLAGLRQFVVDHDLVTIPGPEQALVAEAPPYQRWNFAYIDIAGPYDKDMPSVYNIAPPDPAWTPAERDAYVPGESELLFTSAHEVWPGHFLQFLHANRSASPLGRVFVGYAFAEGWAHYAEEMMWDAGLGRGAPEMHIGQLLEALLRDVRFVCAVGMHTEGLAVADCERLFREQAFANPGSARQQAARGTFDPAYLNYTMGKLMIRKLRDDWTARHGGPGALKAFHDAFLSYGGPPIPLVRDAMLGGGGKLF